MLELLHEQPAPENEDSVLFDIEYKRELFGWACREIQQEFSETTWQAFWQTAVEGQSAADVAAKLNKNVGAVYIAKSRVLARLREKVQQMESEERD